MVDGPDAAEHRRGGRNSWGERRRDSALRARDVSDVLQLPHAERTSAVSMPEMRRELARVVPLIGQRIGRANPSVGTERGKFRTGP
jgi:hypothetical protein